MPVLLGVPVTPTTLETVMAWWPLSLLKKNKNTDPPKTCCRTEHPQAPPASVTDVEPTPVTNEPVPPPVVPEARQEDEKKAE